MSSSDLLIFFAMFARISGFFLVSPLFSKRHIPFTVRFGLALVCSLLLAPPMTMLPHIDSLPVMLMVKELIVGYLLGFLFSLLFEAAMLAGQLVGTMSGFSATELVDPNASTSPLFGRLFMMTLFVLFLVSDLHHVLLRFLFESFTLIPIAPITKSVTWGIGEASVHLFHQALSYALIPVLLLGIVITFFAIFTRFMPSIPIFFIGFPIQMLIGFLAIALAVVFFNEILTKGFFEFLSLTKKTLFSW
ncbi:MAG: Flagellar biosynthetic protein FliR [Chlamydiales bacterium]|nr:Flagellar biosynthetic protein FliR [Chlamydiales bacterium]MCH9620476.1 Flagellar biosynthetic protein FliR [Chlamydiales bacterium]MCH9623461.1 Flagellar biosynthetic protein FliR [Chlamydiales bacterium]